MFININCYKNTLLLYAKLFWRRDDFFWFDFFVSCIIIHYIVHKLYSKPPGFIFYRLLCILYCVDDADMPAPAWLVCIHVFFTFMSCVCQSKFYITQTTNAIKINWSFMIDELHAHELTIRFFIEILSIKKKMFFFMNLKSE